MNKLHITNEKAYVLGALVGGGTIANKTFSVRLPFKEWGSDPHRMNEIARDILTKVGHVFKKSYGIDVTYQIGSNGWVIKPIGDISIEKIVGDLADLKLPTSGVLINNADLSLVKIILSKLSAQYFLSGIFDSRASLADSHRRFVDSAPIVSIEIPGSTKNFNFVVQLCSWLTDLGSVTDQILYNHPTQHSGADPSYGSWKKGFKIRFLASSFLSSHSFALRAKAEGLTQLTKRQMAKPQAACRARDFSPSAVSVHDDIGSLDLPSEVRSKVFLHYHHICAVLGCKYAPVQNVNRVMEDAAKYVSVFPLLSKGVIKEFKSRYMDIIINRCKKTIKPESQVSCGDLKARFSGVYPEIQVALAYLLADELNGKRHKGSKDLILDSNVNAELSLLEAETSDHMPIYIGNPANGRAIIISTPSSIINKKLFSENLTVDGMSINVKQPK